MNTPTPMVVCPYCRAEVVPGTFIAHDVQVHDGLASMRDVHATICESPYARNRECVCRLADYEAVAGGV
jgi:hypothetical protein